MAVPQVLDDSVVFEQFSAFLKVVAVEQKKFAELVAVLDSK